MMRREKANGGIFMASNVANTTAIWNCHINSDSGEIVGPHGDIERLRGLLGPASYKLDAGEMVWITDRTPHESLPVPPVVDAQGRTIVPHRQYFRLVMGPISAWFTNHSTPNPLGVEPPSGVRIISGDKFELYRDIKKPWSFGNAQKVADAYELHDLRLLLFTIGFGHVYERFKEVNIRSLAALVALASSRDENNLFNVVMRTDESLGHGRYYYEGPWVTVLIAAAKTLIQEKKKLISAGCKGAACRLDEKTVAEVVQMVSDQSSPY